MIRLKNYFKNHGLRQTVVTLKDRILHSEQKELPYDIWLKKNRLSSRDYANMVKMDFPIKPVIGVLAHAEGTDRTAFMQSLSLQTYSRFQAAREDKSSDYILFAGPLCSLAPDLLWQCVKLINEHEDTDLIYFDSDRIDSEGRKTDPSMKPDYDPELLDQVNYIGNVFLVRTGLALKAQLPPPVWEGDEYHAFLKRISMIEDRSAGCERNGRIRHIPRVLYHESGSGAIFTDNKDLCNESRSGAVFTDGKDRRHESGSGVFLSDWKAGSARKSRSKSLLSEAESRMPEDKSPLVSVIIPNKDQPENLERCVNSLIKNNTVNNMEILIIENNSSKKETFELYEKLKGSDKRIRLLYWDRPFNYSAINNFGAANACGDYLLLLNNDTEIIEKNSLHFLLEAVSEEGTGAAGALLYYPDGRIQHAGVILGYGGIAGHALQGDSEDELPGSFAALILNNRRNVSAVTAACMMVSRSLFLKLGGFDEDFQVTFNDIDLCLRIRSAGFKILYLPEARLTHFESASRGTEDSEEKVQRFHGEIRHFMEKWKNELEHGDPFYNPNLTLTGRSYSLKDPVREHKAAYTRYLDF